jgi:hypothetical protein
MTKINKASHKAIKKKCSGSQTMDFVSFSVQLRSKQIVPWTFLPVDRTMTVAELCKSIFTDIKEVGENNNPFR